MKRKSHYERRKERAAATAKPAIVEDDAGLLAVAERGSFLSDEDVNALLCEAKSLVRSKGERDALTRVLRILLVVVRNLNSRIEDLSEHGTAER